MTVRDDSVREQIMQVGGRQLRVAIRPGTGTGPPLLLCNGIGMRLEALRPFVDALDPAIEVIRFDPPGTGGSQLPSRPYRFTTLALLLREMLHNLGHQQADVLGISWGGGLAQQFALLNPRRCRRLILVATSTGPQTMVPPNPLPPVKNLILRRWGDLWGGTAKTDPDALASALHKARISPLSTGFLYQHTAALGFTTLPLLPLIRQRTLVLTGDDDPIIPVANGRILAAGIPHATLHVYHGGHVELVTRPSLLTPLITSFLAAPPHDARRAEQVQTGRHPEDQGPRQAAAETDALAEALQAARAAQQAAETAAAQAAAALRDAREQAAATEGASALCAGEGLTGRDPVTAPNGGSGTAGTRARSHIPRSGYRRRHRGCCVITDVIRQDRNCRGDATWADSVPPSDFDSRLSGNLANERSSHVEDRAVTGRLGAAHPLALHIGDFLTDLGNANASAQTIRAYRGDLIQFAAYHDGEVGELSAAPVRTYLAGIGGLAPSTRKRKRAAVASFCKWAVRHDLLGANPMDKIDTIKVPKSLPRPAPAADINRVLGAICSRRPRKGIPLDRLRDRVLFETAYVCGARASEVCGLYIEDLDLRLDDEHVRIHGKGGSIRTVLLDDRGHVALLKLYLARTGYTSGPLFRATINGSGGPLSYDAAHHRWQGYCGDAGVDIDIHQLRHAHGTELINSGVSIEAVRRRLGHSSAETTQLYALLDDKVADAEIRAARRRRDRRSR